ncbi:MAG: hypothetical protein K0Q79_2944 [Flavipsychrobacter sp.]|jgi:hypothetical protein|nr:hypothetical protein [Flavipsychrobacter sp.]
MKYTFMLSCLLTFASIASAQDSLATRAFSMGGGSREFGHLSMRINDDRVVLFNITSNCMTATCNHGMAAILIDKNGNMLRYKKIGSIANDVDPNKAIYTSDGNIIMVGSYSGAKWLIMKMDTMFNVLWTRVIEQKPGSVYSGPYIEDIAEVNHTYYFVFSNIITKVNENGTVIFSKFYGPSATNTSHYTFVNYKSLTPLSANRFYLSGDLKDTASVYEASFHSIADTNGNIIRQKKFKNGAPYGSDISYSFKESANKLKVFGHHNNDIYSADVDTNLNVTNAKKYSGTPMYTHNVCYNGGDRYFLSAYDNTIGKIPVFALDNSGTVQWSKFLLNGAGYFRSTNHMLDYCTFGIYSSTPIGTSLAKKGYWAKLNSNGTTGSTSGEAPLTLTTVTTLPYTVSSTTVVDSGQWQLTFANDPFINDATPVTDSLWFKAVNPATCVYTLDIPATIKPMPSLCSPNPFNGTLAIGSEWELSQINKLTIYDITGRVIVSETNPVSNIISVPTEIKGVVFVCWLYKGEYHTQKLLAQ